MTCLWVLNLNLVDSFIVVVSDSSQFLMPDKLKSNVLFTEIMEECILIDSNIALSM